MENEVIAAMRERKPKAVQIVDAAVHPIEVSLRSADASRCSGRGGSVFRSQRPGRAEVGDLGTTEG